MNNLNEINSSIIIQKAAKFTYHVALIVFTFVILFNQFGYVKFKYNLLIILDTFCLGIVWVLFFLYRKKIVNFKLSSGVLAYITITDLILSNFFFYYYTVSFTNNFLLYTIVTCANILMVGFCVSYIHAYISGVYYLISFALLLIISQDKYLTDNAFVIVFLIMGFSAGISGILYVLKKVHEEELGLKQELHEKETILIRERSEKLHLELEIKQKELTAKTLYLLKFVENNSSFINKLKDLKKEIKNTSLKQLNAIICEHKISHHDKFWNEFETCFLDVHKDFYKNIQFHFPDLSPAERRMAALIRLDLSSKQISDITLNSLRSVEVARSRLRKKLKLKGESNLKDFLNAY